jgi:p-aminobenzoyl-glutamate transporter AbgT
MTGAALGGMLIALVWRGILPYLMKRKEAEELGQPIPSFSTAYMATFIISIIGGLVSVMMVVSELEARLVGVTSIMSSASIGLTFTFTILSGLNTIIDLKTDKIIAAKLGIIKTDEQQAEEAEDKIKTLKREQNKQQQQQPSS